MTTSRSHWAAAQRDVDCLSVRDGVLHVEGVSTLDLAERFGTPLFVFSTAQIRENLRRFQDAFASRVARPGRRAAGLQGQHAARHPPDPLE